MAAYDRRSYAGNAAATTLSGGLTSGATSFSVTAGGGSNYPSGSGGDFGIVIDRGLSTEEKIRCSARSTDAFTVATSGRGYDGTSAQAHSSGATVEHCLFMLDIDEANLAVSKTLAKATAAGQILVVDAAGSFAALQAKTSGQILIGNGTTLVTVAVSGDVTITSGGVVSIGSSKVTSAMLVDGTIVNADINASAAIALSKLASDPLARANHTGTQTGSTISDLTESVQDIVGALGWGGAGLTFTYSDGGNTAVLDVNVDDSTIEIATDTLRVKDAGITAAKLAAGIPRGYVTGAIVTADQNALGAGPTDLTNMTITVVGDGVKRLRIRVKATFAANGGAGQSIMYLKEGATVLDTAQWATSTASDIYTSLIDYDFVPSNASHTYKVAASKNAFDQDLKASSTDRARIYAEWIG